MMNAMITKMIKTWKKYFKDFQCVAGSVLHKVSLKNRVPGTYNLNGLSWIIVDYHGLSWTIIHFFHYRMAIWDHLGIPIFRAMAFTIRVTTF